MTTDLFLNSIKEWFDDYEHQLREIVAEVDGDRRYLIESEKSFEPRLLEYLYLDYVYTCVEEPIRKILRFIKGNRKCQVLDDKISGEFLAEIEDVVLFLNVLSIEYRRMLLKGFDGAIRDNPIVLEGVLQADLDKLMEAAQRFDLGKEFTQIGFFIAFAQKYGTKSEQRLQLAEDILTIKYINNGYTEIRKFFLLDKERDAGKRIWPWLEEFCSYYREMAYCFTDQEKAMINRLLQDEHFKVISKKLGVDVELIINGESLGDTELPTPQIEKPVSQKSIPTIETNTWHLPIDFFTESYIDTCGVNEYFPMFLEHKIKLGRVDKEKLHIVKLQLNLFFEDFINWLAEEGYIDNDSVTKSSFAHALTGRKVDGETKTVTWKRAHKGSSIQNNWTNNISYMIRELYPHTISDENGNVIGRYAHLKKVFSFEEGNRKSSVGSSYPKYADDNFKDKVDGLVKDVDQLAKEFGISPEKDLL